jgi:histidinol dehydrogenase
LGKRRADLAHALAPEHLSIDTRDHEASLGPRNPVAAGDYAAGPSHVLLADTKGLMAHRRNVTTRL